MNRDPDFNSGCHQCNYLLGVIEERRGATAQAVAAFELAAQDEWELRRDALVHLVGLELQRKNCSRSDELLGQLPPPDPVDVASVAMAAEVDLCQGRSKNAITRLRILAAGSYDEGRRSEILLLLARALLENPTVGDTDRTLADDEAMQFVRDAVSQPSVSAAALELAKDLMDQVELRRQRTGAQHGPNQERAALLDGLVETRRWPEAQSLARELLAQSSAGPAEMSLQCRVMFNTGRIAAATSERKLAIETFEWVTTHCDDADLGARAQFLGAGLLSASGKREAAIAQYAELERRFPTHRLADDARLKQALLHRGAGSESRFVALLDSMPEDYPNGDMVLEGLFQLALKSMLQRNWPAALLVLERAERFAASSGKGKDVELDRQRYFLARAYIEDGRAGSATSILRDIVVRRPLTYYMLLAYATLLRRWPNEADSAQRDGLQRSGEEVPASFVPAEERPIVVRLSALLGVGDLKAADDLLQQTGRPAIGESTVFTVAGMYANAGAVKTALALVKRRGRDWRVRWPAFGWLELWQQAYPLPYRAIVRREALRNGLGEPLVYAIMREESEFDPRAVSAAEAFGLMQLIVPTARLAGRELGINADAKLLQKPAINIAIGAKVLAQLAKRFSGQSALVAAGYNAGPGRPLRWLREYPETDLDLWIELIEFPETRGYVKRVLETQAAYRWLYPWDDSSAAVLEVLPPQLRAGRAG